MVRVKDIAKLTSDTRLTFIMVYSQNDYETFPNGYEPLCMFGKHSEMIVKEIVPMNDSVVDVEGNWYSNYLLILVEGGNVIA